MSKRKSILGFIIVFTSFIMGCGGDEIKTVPTIEMQMELDSIAIAEYIAKKGHEPALLDTTASGVIYFVLEEGSGDSIKYNDIVSLYLTVKLTDGTLVRTNIDTVLQNHDLYDSTAIYRSLTITHTQTGWAIAPPENDFLELKGFVGMREGMSAVLSNMKIGGKGVFITPSITSLQSSLSGSVNFPLREPFIFEVYPTRIR